MPAATSLSSAASRRGAVPSGDGRKHSKMSPLSWGVVADQIGSHLRQTIIVARRPILGYGNLLLRFRSCYCAHGLMRRGARDTGLTWIG